MRICCAILDIPIYEERNDRESSPNPNPNVGGDMGGDMGGEIGGDMGGEIGGEICGKIGGEIGGDLGRECAADEHQVLTGGKEALHLLFTLYGELRNHVAFQRELAQERRTGALY